jgi:hypothetical protein
LHGGASPYISLANNGDLDNTFRSLRDPGNPKNEYNYLKDECCIFAVAFVSTFPSIWTIFSGTVHTVN